MPNVFNGVLLLILLPLSFALSAARSSIAAAEDNPCLSDEYHHIVVNTRIRRLFLCASGKVYRAFPVSIGRGGTGKNKAGDNKTPLGAYSLARPRASNKFYIFIPVNYPTSEQKARDFTGGDIGIHGPQQSLSWVGRQTTLIDWTQGCIAVGENTDIEEIADWVEEAHVSKIIIR